MRYNQLLAGNMTGDSIWRHAVRRCVRCRTYGGGELALVGLLGLDLLLRGSSSSGGLLLSSLTLLDQSLQLAKTGQNSTGTDTEVESHTEQAAKGGRKGEEKVSSTFLVDLITRADIDLHAGGTCSVRVAVSDKSGY